MGKNKEFESEHSEQLIKTENKEKPTLLEIGRARREAKVQGAKKRFSGLGGKIKRVFMRIGKAGSTSVDAFFGVTSREGAKIVGAEAKAGAEAAGRGIKRGAEFGAGVVVESGMAIGRGAKTGAEIGAGLAIEGGIAVGRGVKKGAEAGAEAVVAGARGAKRGAEAVGRGGKWLGSEAKDTYLAVDDWAERKLEDFGEWQDAKYADLKGWAEGKWAGIQGKGREIKQGFSSGVDRAKEMYSHFKEARAEAAKQRKLADLRAEMNRSLEAIRWNDVRYKEAEEQMNELEGIDDLSEALAAEAAE